MARRTEYPVLPLNDAIKIAFNGQSAVNKTSTVSLVHRIERDSASVIHLSPSPAPAKIVTV